MDNVLLSSDKMDWETPYEFFTKIDHIFHFSLDVCADDSNTKCLHFYSKEDNSLTKTWQGICWMNPPYGREITKWLEKASKEITKEEKTIIIALVPARTETVYHFKYVYPFAKAILYIAGRIRFVGATNSAPFPSELIIYANCNIDKELELLRETKIGHLTIIN